jgi:hypothetical protein
MGLAGKDTLFAKLGFFAESLHQSWFWTVARESRQLINWDAQSIFLELLQKQQDSPRTSRASTQYFPLSHHAAHSRMLFRAIVSLNYLASGRETEI